MLKILIQILIKYKIIAKKIKRSQQFRIYVSSGSFPKKHKLASLKQCAFLRKFRRETLKSFTESFAFLLFFALYIFDLRVFIYYIINMVCVKYYVHIM